MNKLLNKQPLSEAIQKKNMWECMPIVDVQPTNPGNLLKIIPPCTPVDQDLQGYAPLCTPDSTSTTEFIKDKSILIGFSACCAGPKS